MHWLLAVLVGHFLNAISYVLDKVLLTKSIQNPFAFTFYIGILGLLAVLLIPFGFEVPSAGMIGLNLAAGALFIVALLFFFLALKGQETSRIVPFIGGGVPLFTWVFELLFLDTQLSGRQLIAFAVLVVGTVVIAIEVGDKKSKPTKVAQKERIRDWSYALAAAFFFAIAFGLTKIAFDNQPFFSAFIWMRFGSFLFPLLFLLWPKNRKAITDSFSMFKEKAGYLYLVAQGFGAAGFIFVNYAISLASVSLVNALQGVQYAFLLIIAIIGTVKFPKLLQETMNKKSLAIKIVGVFIIAGGLYLIAQSV
ncbi:hypothetical protein ACFL2M_00905 [Patescibacteria group bacterium]